MMAAFNFFKYMSQGFYIDGNIICCGAIFIYWGWKDRATSFYITAVICSAFVLSNLFSLITREPMPLMTYDSYPVNGLCTFGLGSSTSLISLSAASLVIYYDNKATVSSWGTSYDVYYAALNVVYVFLQGIQLLYLG